MRSKFKELMFCLLFMPSASFGSGFPVVDTNEMFQQMNDSIYLLSTIEDLLAEFNVSNNDIKALSDLKGELKRLNDDMHLYKDMYNDLSDISDPQFSRGQVIADYISQVTMYIRKVKKFIILAQSSKQRPQSLSAALDMMREQRERQKDQYEAAMRSYEEKERVGQFRRELRRKIYAKQSMNKEYAMVSKTSEKSTISSISFKEHKGSQSQSLW